MNYQQKYFKPYYQLAKTLPFHQRSSLEHTFYNQSHLDNITEEDFITFRYHRNGYEPVWEVLYRQGDLSQKKRRQLATRAQDKVDAECTFQPSITKNRRYLIANNSTFFQRNQIWCDNKIEKVVRQKEQEVNENLKDCTFQPIINSRSKKIHQKTKQRNKQTTKQAIITKKYIQQRENKKNQSNIKKNVIQVGKLKKIIREELKRIQL